MMRQSFLPRKNGPGGYAWTARCLVLSLPLALWMCGAACAKEEAPRCEPPAGTTWAPPEDLLQAVVQQEKAVCHYQERCSASVGRSTRDLPTCERRAEGQGSSPWIQSLRGLPVDGAAQAQCVQFYLGGTCDPNAAQACGSFAACGQVSRQAVVETYCDPNAPNTTGCDQCTPTLPEGGACALPQQCRSRACSNGVCGAVPPPLRMALLNQVCGPDAVCFTGLGCVDGTCRQSPTTGEPCDAGGCVYPLECRPSGPAQQMRCTARAADGAACSRDPATGQPVPELCENLCVFPTLDSVQGQCAAALPGPNQPCAAITTCAPGLWREFQPGLTSSGCTCRAPKTAGEACTMDEQCGASGLCVLERCVDVGSFFSSTCWPVEWNTPVNVLDTCGLDPTVAQHPMPVTKACVPMDADCSTPLMNTTPQTAEVLGVDAVVTMRSCADQAPHTYYVFPGPHPVGDGFQVFVYGAQGSPPDRLDVEFFQDVNGATQQVARCFAEGGSGRVCSLVLRAASDLSVRLGNTLAGAPHQAVHVLLRPVGDGEFGCLAQPSNTTPATALPLPQGQLVGSRLCGRGTQVEYFFRYTGGGSPNGVYRVLAWSEGLLPESRGLRVGTVVNGVFAEASALSILAQDQGWPRVQEVRVPGIPAEEMYFNVDFNPSLRTNVLLTLAVEPAP